MNVRESLTQPVPWSIFIWAVGIVSVLLGALFVQHNIIHEALATEKEARIAGDAQQLQLSNDLKAQYAEIQATLRSLDARLVELRQDIRTK